MYADDDYSRISREIRSQESGDRERWGLPLKKKDGTPWRDRWGRQVYGYPHEAKGHAVAVFRAWLPPTPLGACSLSRAQRYVDSLTRVLDEHAHEMTRAERSYLYRIRKKWRLRAEGKDPRFVQLGGAFGGTTNRHRPYTPADCARDCLATLEPHRRKGIGIGSDRERYTDPRASEHEESMVDRVKRQLKDVGRI